MAETYKGRSYIDILDNGDIYIESGNESTPITKLGKGNSEVFKPYSKKVESLNLLYIYSIEKEYIPAKFETTDDFVYALEQQSVNNEYIHNYLNLGAEQLFQFLDNNGLIDNNTYFLNIQNGSNITDVFFEYLTEQAPNQIIQNAIYSNTDFDIDDVSIDESAPEDIRNYLKDLFNQVKRVDRTYTFNQLDLEPKYLKYINGFINLNKEELSKIPKISSVILISNFYSSRSLILETYRKLEDLGISVLVGCVVAKKDIQ